MQHTGFDAGDYASWQAMVARSGIITFDGLEEALDALVASAMLPPTCGNRMAIIGPGGVVSVTSVHTCDRLGLSVPLLTSQMIASLAVALRSTGEPFREEIRFQEQQRSVTARIPAFVTPTHAPEAMAKVVHFDRRYPRTRAQPS